MSNIYFLERYAEMRQQELEEEARLARLIQAIEAEKPSLWQKLTWKVGNWMIALGHKLMMDNFKPIDRQETAHN
jgi:hypothetical protein